MHYYLIRERFGQVDATAQLDLISRFLKKEKIKRATKIYQSTSSDGVAQLNKQLLKSLGAKDVLVISQLSILESTFTPIIDTLFKLLKANVIVYSVAEGERITTDRVDLTALQKAFEVSKKIERSLLKDRAARGLQKRKRDGHLGRPKGTRSGKTKLSGQEAAIRKLIEDRVSISAIARIHKVNRITATKFINRLKEEEEK